MNTANNLVIFLLSSLEGLLCKEFIKPFLICLLHRWFHIALKGVTGYVW